MIRREILKKIRQIELRTNRIVNGALAGFSFASLLFFCSCATAPKPSAFIPAAEFPAATTINKSAGRGGMLFVNLRLEDGQECLFGVDTGSEGTIFDKSLQPKLGKRLGAITLSGWRGKTESELYAAPNLYLGNVRLVTDKQVAVSDFQWQSAITGRRVMGILGMDCLKHYCIQLDFEAGKMYFLKPGQMESVTPGKVFPMVFKNNCPFIHHQSFVGGENSQALIDSGCVFDGLVEPGMVKSKKFETAPLQNCIWSGETYSNLVVATGANVVGLRFLARHLVTLDFPKQTLYLKKRNVGPLVDENVDAALEFLKALKEKGDLPGWPKDANGETTYPEADSNSVTINIGEHSGATVYHYTASRISTGGAWKLQKAWRTDKTDKTIDEFSIP
jgi:hypothetical protein